MTIFNCESGYGGLTKALHWAVAILFALQYASATVMVRTPAEGETLGITQAAYFNWHKSLGLIAFGLAILRLANRRVGALPPWAPTLTVLEQALIHRAEQLLYLVMFVMPLSGFVYVMAGGYGVRLFGLVDLPNPIGSAPLLATAARWTHLTSAILLLLPLGAHLGIVLSHHLVLKDGIIARMLPRKSRP